MAALVMPNVIVTTIGSPRDRTVTIGRNPPKHRTVNNFRNVHKTMRMVSQETETDLTLSVVESVGRTTMTATPCGSDPKKLFEVIKRPFPYVMDNSSSRSGSTVKRANLSRRTVKSAFVRKPKSVKQNSYTEDNDLEADDANTTFEDDRISVQLQLGRKLSYKDILRKLFEIWEPQLSESYRHYVQYVPAEEDDRMSCISTGSIKSRNSHTNVPKTRFRAAEAAVEAVHKFDSHKADRRKSLFPGK